MIAKRILRKRSLQAKNDKGLFSYVVNEKNGGRGDPTTWKLAEYTLDTAHGGEKVAYSRVTNCSTDDVGWAVKEILATQARNTRSNTDKSYHLVISFPEGERPTQEQIRDIEDEAVRAIGLQDHQRISAVHQNTENWHLHVAINKVHPRTFRNVEPWYDQFRLQDACAELELKHGLHRDNHTLSPDHVATRVAQMEAHAGRKSFVTWAKETAAEAIIEAARQGTSWADMHATLAQFDIEIRPRGAGLVIGHRQDKRFHVKASDIAREVAFKALVDRWGPYQPPAGVEVGQGEQSEAPHRTQAPAPNPVGKHPQRYVAPPLQRGPGVASLWERYQSERQSAEQSRARAFGDLKAQHITHGQEVEAYYKQRLARTKTLALTKADRIESYQHIRADRRRALLERIDRERQDRQRITASHPVISWQQFLEREASLGDRGALSALRSRTDKQQAVVEQIITAKDHSQAVDFIHANMKPFVSKNGTVFYTIKDGGKVVDAARYISVPDVTVGAVTLALDLAVRKYSGGELIVRGSPDFQRSVMERAATLGLSARLGKLVEKDIQLTHTVLVRTNMAGMVREQHNGVERGR